MEKVLVFIFDRMTDYEITLAMHLLTASLGKEIVTIAYGDKEIVSRSGAIYKPHRLVSDPLNQEATGLIICGGWYGDYRNELHELIRDLHSKEALIAGICGAGTYMVAKSGLLDGVNFTTPIIEWKDEQKKVFGEVDPFPRNNYQNERIVRVNNIITSVGQAFIDFAVEICAWYKPFDTEEDKQNFLGHLKG